MKMHKYTFMFKAGDITVTAFCESEGRILAQAEAIKRGWEYDILAFHKGEVKSIYMYEVLVSIIDDAVFYDRVRYVYAQNETEAINFIINLYRFKYGVVAEVLGANKIEPEIGLILKDINFQKKGI